MLVQTVANFETEIGQAGKIATRAEYWSHSDEIHGPSRLVPMPPTGPAPGSQVIQVGNSPDGFGKGVVWDRSTQAVLLALFVNAADGLGVSISGVKSTDTITVTSVDGLGSFAQDTGNPLASSIIGIIGAGLSGVLMATGIGAIVSPLVDDATKFAQSQFAPTHAKTKIRDAFGVDPGNGQVARQEGGVLITLPAADGPYYSGDDNHQSRWILKGGSRDDAHRPAQVVHGFFPVRSAPVETNERLAGADGDVYVTPWDWKFQDNAGYYKVIILISQ
jgi:hypothetical protein